jgi:hypothetical protein
VTIGNAGQRSLQVCAATSVDHPPNGVGSRTVAVNPVATSGDEP